MCDTPGGRPPCLRERASDGSGHRAAVPGDERGIAVSGQGKEVKKYKEGIRMNASVAIQSLPEAANDEELIRIVDEVIDYIKSTGLSYYVGPFETAIEGDYDELMDIIKECQHIAIRAGAPSVAAYIKVTYKPEGEVLTIDKKVTKHHQ